MTPPTRRHAPRPDARPLTEKEFRDLVGRLRGRVEERGLLLTDLRPAAAPFVFSARVGWGRTDDIFLYHDDGTSRIAPHWFLNTAEVTDVLTPQGTVERLRRLHLFEMWNDLWWELLSSSWSGG